MSDDRLRAAERAWRETRDDEAEVRYLRELLRAGRVDRQRLVLAAALDHPPAVAVLAEPPVEPLAPAAWAEKVGGLAAALGPDVTLRAAVAVARSVPVHGDRFDGPSDDAMRVLEALDGLALAEPAARPARVARLREELTERWAGGVGNVATVALAVVLEPENAPTLLRDLLAQALDDFGRDLRAGLRDDLARWLTGLDDPVRARAAGVRFGTDPNISRAIAYSPDATLVATACWSGHVTLRDATTGAERLVARHRPRDVFGLAFSPDGARLVQGDIDGRVVAWDAATGAELSGWTAHEDGVNGLEVLPDGRVATVGPEGSLRVWSPDGAKGLTLQERPDRLRALAVSPDGRRVATLAPARLTVWDLAAEAPAWSVEHPDGASDVAWSRDRLLTVDDHGLLRRWSAAAGELVDELRVHARGAYALAVSPDGHLAVTVHDRAAVVTNLTDGLVQDAYWLPGVQLSCAFAPDGRSFLVGARTGALRRYGL